MEPKFAPKIKIIAWVFLFFLSQSSFAQEPNPGPRSIAEAKVLFEEANSHFEQQKYEIAIHDLTRFLQRYPSHPSATQAELLLGEAYQNQKKFQESLEPFRHFIEQASRLGLGQSKINSTKLLLAKSHLNLKNDSEAFSLTQEVLKLETDSHLQQVALLIKTEVLCFQKKYKEARSALDAFDHLGKPSERSLLFHFRLQTEDCASLLPPRTSLDDYEESMMGYFKTKTICFKEALLSLHPSALKNEPLTQDPVRVWCQEFKHAEAELKQSRLDSVVKDKVYKNFELTQNNALTTQKELLNCDEPHSP